MGDAGFPSGPAGQVDLPSIVVGSELVITEAGTEVGPIHIRCQCGAIIRLGRTPTVGELGLACEAHRRLVHRVVHDPAAGPPRVVTDPAPAELPAEHLGATCPCWTMVGGPRNHSGLPSDEAPGTSGVLGHEEGDL